MRIRFVPAALAFSVVSSITLAQTAPPAEADQGIRREATQEQAVPDAASYGLEDCREDMANVQQASRDGHLTDKGVAAQKEMALAKVKRDTGQAPTSGGNGTGKC